MLNILAANPLFALFFIMATGLALGKIKVGGISLGAAAAMFVALGLSTANPDIQIPPFVYQMGLALFVYAIGLNYGPAFFRDFKERGWKLTLFMLGMFVVLIAAGYGVIRALGLDTAIGAGMFAGSLSSTPGMAAAVDMVGNSTPVVGYSLVYPGSVLGVILVAAVGAKLLKVDHAADARAEGVVAAPLEWKAVRVTRSFGPEDTIGRLHALTGAAVVGTRLVGQERHRLAAPDTPLETGQVLVLNGTAADLDAAIAALGEEAHVDLAEEHGLIFRRITVSNPEVAGRAIADLDCLEHGFLIARVRKGDRDVVPHPEMTLNYSDRVRVVCAPENLPEVRKYFGDSEDALGNADLLPLALGLSLGLLVGLIPIPMPGGAVLKLGFGGGPIVMGLLLGWRGRTGPLNWQIPFHTRQTLSTLGLTVFLSGVGTSAGAAFAKALQDPTSLIYIGVGLGLTLLSAVLIGFIGMRVLRLKFDEAMGVAAGMTTNPAVFSFVHAQAKTELVGRGYATVYPTTIIGKIVATQILLMLLL